MTARLPSSLAWGASFCLLIWLASACGGTLDVGWDNPHGMLPVDNRNPVVLCNDGVYENWAGEYAALFASSGVLSLVGIVIATGPNESTNLDDNMTGWRQMAAAARDGGLQNIPDPMASSGPALVRPSDGKIDSTVANRSEGAHFIVDTSIRLSQPYRPLVVITGGRLTDIADAYLMDHTLPDRIVVVSSLGTTTTDGAEMGPPNGEIDQWADRIVAQKFRYVQVSSFYDQLNDVPESLVAQLPQNAFTSWIEAKRTRVYNNEPAADQVAVVAVAVPEFVSAVSRVVLSNPSSESIPVLSRDSEGPIWLVTRVNGGIATARLWDMLLDPAGFHTR